MTERDLWDPGPQARRALKDELLREERSPGTVRKYLRDLATLDGWLTGRPLTRETAAAWKEHLTARGYAPATVNSMLGAVNKFLSHAGAPFRVRYLRLQRRLFRGDERDLTREEYGRLLSAAREAGRERLALLLEAICSTGIRVSEVRYLTVEAARARRADVALKGKIRTILLPGKLCRRLLAYARRRGVGAREIFRTAAGRGLSRKQIWAEMKSLCPRAGVAPSKVFPHNLRHLFARTFYRACRDMARLADILGHSSVETTRLYLISTGAEHARQMARLGLLS